MTQTEFFNKLPEAARKTWIAKRTRGLYQNPFKSPLRERVYNEALELWRGVDPEGCAEFENEHSAESETTPSGTQTETVTQ